MKGLSGLSGAGFPPLTQAAAIFFIFASKNALIAGFAFLRLDELQRRQVSKQLRF